MKRLSNTLLHITSCVSLIALFLLLFSKSVSAQTASNSSCSCTPGTTRIECVDVAPNFKCLDLKDTAIDWGKTKILKCAPDCQSWVDAGEGHSEACLLKFTPKHYSLEKSVGDLNEYTEGKIHSGTRDVGIDASDPNNYGAVAALVPAGGPNHELRVKFTKKYGEYEVYLGLNNNPPKKKAIDIWNKCTDNGDLDHWREYQEKLEACPQWGFVPTTLRRLASEPTPAVKTLKPYFEESESPIILTWQQILSLEWIKELFQSFFCNTFGWLCPEDERLKPLRNPDDAPGWTGGKPNIPAEAESNAKLLRQFLLPVNFPLGKLPQGNESYFDLKDLTTKKLLEETGQTTRQTSAEGGFFRIFQPMAIDPNPAFCQEGVPSPPEGCASDLYYDIYYPPTSKTITCYTDTPDEETTWTGPRPTDDRPLYLRTGMEFFQQSLWPKGLIRPNP